MTPLPLARSLAPLLLILSLTACATAELPTPAPETPIVRAPVVIEAPADAIPAIGEGAYRYQPTLRDSDGKPMAQTPFALSLQTGDLVFVAEEKKVWRGVTDLEGRTPVFALPHPIKVDDLLLRPRLGDGPIGEQMRLVDPAGAPLANIPYRLVLCTDPPQQYLGVSDDQGYTAYGASSEPRKLLLSMVFATFASDDEPETSPIDLEAKQLEENEQACDKDG